MNLAQRNEVKGKLLDALMLLAPTGKEQRAIVSRAFAAARDAQPGESDKAELQYLVNALVDGVNHGNWPR